jgi:hypothetical protein
MSQPTQEYNPNVQTVTYVAMDTQPVEELSTGQKGAVIAIVVFLGLWIIAGIIAFIVSIICFGRSGTTGQHIVGLLLAIFFGPLYWIYYGVVGSYCRKDTPPMYT